MAAAKPKIVYWKPGGVVRGTQVYLDANFLVGLARPDHIWHTNASALRDSLAERNTKLVLSSLAFNEAIYQLLRLEQKDQEGGENTTTGEMNWPDRLEQAALTLPNLSFFEPPDATFHRQVIRAVYDLKLDPTDAFHYAAARRLSCPIVTNDAGFQKIPDQNLTIVTFF